MWGFNVKQEFILLTVFIIAAAFVALLSLYGIKISKNDEPNYPYSHSYRYMCSVVGLFCSILFSILSVISFFVGGFNPENRTETKTKQVTSVEKSGDKIAIYNSDSYKIVIDLKENTESLYHNSDKLENVTINGYWDLRDNYQYIKNKDLLVNTDYTISKKGNVKSVFIEVVKNKNKDDFKVEY